MSRNRPSIEDDEALARELQEQFAAEFRQSQQQMRSGNVMGDALRGTAENSSSWTARRGAGQPPPAAAAPPTIAAIPDARRTSHGASARVRTSVSTRGTQLPPPPDTNRLSGKTASAGEDYASRLERALRDEDRAALQSSSHHRRSEIPPRASDPDGSSFPASYDRNPPSRNPSYTSAPPPSQPPPGGLSSLSAHSRGSIVDADEEYARSLQNEIRMEEAARSTRRGGDRNLGTGSSHHSRKASPGIETPATLSDDVSEMTSDEEMARRVEQELRDEELARRLASQEQARLSERRAQQIQAVSVSRTVSSSRKCSVRRVLSYLVPSLVLIGVVVGVLLYFTTFNQEIPFLPTPQDFQNEDPFNAKNASEVDKWRTQGDVGLSLEVVAALESIWLPYFETAVFQWDNGSPDALTLSKTYEDHQTVCDPVNFKLIVCNGNYGDTRWRGINKILLADGFIFASTAKMNEYYFTGSSNTDDQRQVRFEFDGYVDWTARRSRPSFFLICYSTRCATRWATGSASLTATNPSPIRTWETAWITQTIQV